MQVWYSVTAKFSDLKVRDEYLAWLADGHMQAVITGGAVQARSVILDGDHLTVQSQYIFPSRQAYDGYVAVHAPALRVDGLKRFPPERGVTFARQLGNIRVTLGPQTTGSHS
jgi:hypothetical protein